MLNEAIILAGGKGTRLQSSVPGLPKCLAPVNGHPFLHYLIQHLQHQGIRDFIFALGFQSSSITAYLEEAWPHLSKKYSAETKPLGTGGAIKKALSLAGGNDVLVANGDTIFKASLANAAALHHINDARCTMMLKPMNQTDRYGTVAISKQSLVTSFREKQPGKPGLINAGSYLLKTSAFDDMHLPEVFSFEKDYLEKLPEKLYGYTEDAYFIDIGIPADYEKAQSESIYF